MFSPADQTSLYLGTQYVMKTTDGGLHWQQISPDLTGAVAGTSENGPTTPANANSAAMAWSTPSRRLRLTLLKSGWAAIRDSSI